MAPQIKPLQGRERAPGWQPQCGQGLRPHHHHGARLCPDAAPSTWGVGAWSPDVAPSGICGQGEVPTPRSRVRAGAAAPQGDIGHPIPVGISGDERGWDRPWGQGRGPAVVRVPAQGTASLSLPQRQQTLPVFR